MTKRTHREIIEEFIDLMGEDTGEDSFYGVKHYLMSRSTADYTHVIKLEYEIFVDLKTLLDGIKKSLKDNDINETDEIGAFWDMAGKANGKGLLRFWFGDSKVEEMDLKKQVLIQGTYLLIESYFNVHTCETPELSFERAKELCKIHLEENIKNVGKEAIREPLIILSHITLEHYTEHIKNYMKRSKK